MYLKHYGLSREPFRPAADPAFFYTSTKHQEALSCLQYAIEYRKGFGILTGGPGSGKTTISRVLLERLDPSISVAMITNTHLDERELIYMVLSEFGEEVEFEEKCILLEKLKEYLIKNALRGGNPVLIVDEAHNLDPKVLEEIRMLANIESESEKLIQIILIGQPELEDILGSDDKAQLQQLFPVGVHLSSLNLEETKEYIKFRLEKAGAGNNGIITEDAVEITFSASRGVPGIINNICDACLVSGYALGVECVDGAIAREAIIERASLFSSGESGNTVGQTEKDTIGKGHIPSGLKLRLSHDRSNHRLKAGNNGNKKLPENEVWLHRAFGDIVLRELPSGGKIPNRRLKITSAMSIEDIGSRLLMEYKPREFKSKSINRINNDGVEGKGSTVRRKKTRRDKREKVEASFLEIDRKMMAPAVSELNRQDKDPASILFDEMGSMAQTRGENL